MDDDITDRARQHHEAHHEIPDPTPFERIISWVKIAFATRKAVMFIWALVIGTGGSVVVGQVTDTTPLRDAAVAIGILDERPAVGDVDGVVFDEIINLTEDIKVGMATVTENQRIIREMESKLDALSGPHSHDLLEHTHPLPDLSHEHSEYATVQHEHDTTHTHPPPAALLDSASLALIQSEVTSAMKIIMETHVDEVH